MYTQWEYLEMIELVTPNFPFLTVTKRFSKTNSDWGAATGRRDATAVRGTMDSKTKLRTDQNTLDRDQQVRHDPWQGHGCRWYWFDLLSVFSFETFWNFFWKFIENFLKIINNDILFFVNFESFQKHWKIKSKIETHQPHHRVGHGRGKRRGPRVDFAVPITPSSRSSSKIRKSFTAQRFYVWIIFKMFQISPYWLEPKCWWS